MKNKVEDLRNHMFAAMERLSEDNLSPEELKKEVERARAISELGKVIVESAKTEILYAKVTGNESPKNYFGIDGGEKLQIERPKAEYANKRAYEFAR